MTEAFIWDHNTPHTRRTDGEETEKILAEIHNEIVRENRRYTYSHKVYLSCIKKQVKFSQTNLSGCGYYHLLTHIHSRGPLYTTDCVCTCIYSILQWREGDFIITDNLAVGHEASPDTQLPRSEVGLRVMHRTTIKGTHRPCKTV